METGVKQKLGQISCFDLGVFVGVIVGLLAIHFVDESPFNHATALGFYALVVFFIANRTQKNLVIVGFVSANLLVNFLVFIQKTGLANALQMLVWLLLAYALAYLVIIILGMQGLIGSPDEPERMSDPEAFVLRNNKRELIITLLASAGLGLCLLILKFFGQDGVIKFLGWLFVCAIFLRGMVKCVLAFSHEHHTSFMELLVPVYPIGLVAIFMSPPPGAEISDLFAMSFWSAFAGFIFLPAIFIVLLFVIIVGVTTVWYILAPVRVIRDAFRSFKTQPLKA